MLQYTSNPYIRALTDFLYTEKRPSDDGNEGYDVQTCYDIE